MPSKPARLILGLFALLLTNTILPVLPTHAQTIAVRSAVVFPGDTITIPVEISSDVTEVYGFQLDLEKIAPQNAALLRINNVKRGSALTLSSSVDTNPLPPTFQGMRIAASTVIPSGNDPRPTFSGPGAVFDMEILIPSDATAGQVYHLILNHVIFAGLESQPIDLTVFNGALTIGDVTTLADTIVPPAGSITVGEGLQKSFTVTVTGSGQPVPGVGLLVSVEDPSVAELLSNETVVTGSDGTTTIDILGKQNGTTSIRIAAPGLADVLVDITTEGVSPVITSSPILEVDAGGSYSYDVEASDPQNDTITYHLIEGPAGMTINETSGLISWPVPAAPLAREQAVTIEARDPSTNAGPQSFTIFITVDADSDTYDDRIDCDDNDSNVNPGAIETPYDGLDNDCNPDTPDNDLDGDGALFPADCDDSNPSINPVATEILYNNVDDDCNPVTVDYVDSDNDGYCSQFSADCPLVGIDCNDTDPNIHPGAEEIKNNGIDDDCNTGTPDILSDAFLVAIDQNNYIYYAKSQGDGSFADYKVLHDIGSYKTRAIAIADFDNDGHMDFLAGGGVDDSIDVYLFLNDGTDTFVNKGIVAEHAVAGDWAMEMGAGDFNHDGRVDFALSTQEEAVVIGLQNSLGGFDTTDIALHGNTRGLDVADINWDGHLDLVAGNADGAVHVYPGNGDGSFSGGILVGNTGGQSDGTTAADFDGDGLIDIIAVNFSTGDPYLYKNNGDGSFTDLGYIESLDTDRRTGYDGYDFNNDGHVDVIACNYNLKDILFFAGNGDGTFAEPVQINTTNTDTYVLGISAPPYNAFGTPYALITPKEQVLLLGQTANLDGTSSHDNDDGGSIISWEWNFGDGTATEPGQTSSHTYTEENIYNVTLKVMDNQGKNAISAARVILQAAPPVADAGGPYVFGESFADDGVFTTTLDGSGSFDTDSGIIKYEWDFGDGWSDDFNDGQMDGWTFVSGDWEIENGALRQTNESVSNNYTIFAGNPSAGDYTVEADIRIMEGYTQDTRLIFRARDADNYYALSLRAGAYDDIRLVRYINGSMSTLKEINLPFNVALDTLYRLKVSAYGDIISFYLDDSLIWQLTDSTFSKGQIGFQTYKTHARFDNIMVSSKGEGVNPVHGYAKGSYTATLTVTDKAGQTATDTAQIDIVPGAPPVSVPGNNISLTESDGHNGTWTVFFNGTGSSDDVNIIRYDWDFGDGTSKTGDAPFHEFEPSVFPATYTVTLTVTDNALQTNTAQLKVNIDVSPGSIPTANTGGPYVVNEEAAHAGLWTIPFDVSGSTDDVGIARYEWNFGDGNSLTTWCGEDRLNFFSAGTRFYGYDVVDAGLYIYASQDNTSVRIVNLETGEVLKSAVINQYEGTGEMAPGNGIYFKVEADKPVVAYQTYKSTYKQRNHAAFAPSLDQGPVGKEFLFYLIEGTDFFVFAVEDSLVKFYRSNGTLLAEQQVTAGSYWSPELYNKSLYHVVSSGRIAMQTVGDDDMTTVPATNGTGVGTAFYFAVNAENTGALTVFAYNDATVTVSDMDTGEVLWTKALVTGQSWLQTEVGTRRLKLESTGDVEVWAGDINENINAATATISDMGDDISFAGGRQGKEFYTHGLRDGLVIFAPYDGTLINANGLEQTLDADGFLHLSGGASYHITATQPVIIQTLGVADSEQEVGTYLGGICQVYNEYDTVGTYDVTLTVYDHAGQSSTSSTTVTIEDSDPPVAEHGGPYTANEGSSHGGRWQIQFDAGASTDDFGIYKYEWDFDNSDGIQVDATGVNPIHFYSESGTYTVTLRIYDHALQMTEVTTHVTIEANNPPIAHAGGPYVFGEEIAVNGLFHVTFNGSESLDDFGIYSYEWDFDDAFEEDFSGTILDETQWVVNGNVTQVDMMTLKGAGSWDDTNCFSKADFAREGGNVFTSRMRIRNTSSNSYSIWGLKNNSELYNNRSHMPYGIYFVNSGSIQIFEDGSNRGTVGTFIKDQWYDVKITLKPGGQGAIYHYRVSGESDWITLYDSDHATITTRFKVGFLVYKGTHDMDDVRVYKRSADAVSSHAYDTAGARNVTLTVVDHSSQKASQTVPVTLSKGNPPVADAGGPYTAEPFSMVRFNGTGSTDDTNIARYEWDFGDGHTAIGAGPDHFYRENGTHTVTLTVYDNVLQSDTATTSITIATGSAPLAEAGGPYTGGVDGPPIYFDGSGSNDDNGILEYAWTFPIINDTFSGTSINTEIWDTGTSYDGEVFINAGELVIKGRTVTSEYWGSGRIATKRTIKRNSSMRFSARVKPETGTFTVGWKDATNANSNRNFIHGFRFNSANEIVIQEDSYSRAVVGTYSADTWYTVAIELKAKGARYFIDDQLVYDSNYSEEIDLKAAISAGNNLQRADDLKVEKTLYGKNPTGTGIAQGIYTVALVVEDGAGQTATDTATVQILANLPPRVICVPWVGSDPKFPHETWNGKKITLKGVVKDANATRYQWDFGDGTHSGIINIVDPYNLSATHTYPDAPEGTPFVATLTAWDSDGETGSDTYNIIVKNKTLDTEINVAIDEALWNLHLQQDRSGEETDGQWTGQANVSTTASILQAFQINTHLNSNDPRENPYTETVTRGMNWLLSMMDSTTIEAQTYGDPDSNGNGIAVGLTRNNAPYQMGMVMMSLAASGTPLTTAHSGVDNVNGRLYYDILTDMVDLYAWGQTDYGNQGGGWQYQWNYGTDNSASQWAALGMESAEETFNIPVPQWVKDRNLQWLKYSTTSSTGIGYGYTQTGDGIATTWGGLAQVAFDDIPTTDWRWIGSLNNVAKEWDDWYVDTRNYYALYAMAKALRISVPNEITVIAEDTPWAIDWFRDPERGVARTILDDQLDDGSFCGHPNCGDDEAVGRSYIVPGPFRTAWGVVILSQTLFVNPPVADAGSDRVWGVDRELTLDGSNSYHTDPFRKIVRYEWDVNGDGSFDLASPDPTAVHTYLAAVYTQSTLPRDITVTLRVTDDNIPSKTDTDTATITIAIPPHPPVAVHGGAYTATMGVGMTLDGSGSFDIDPTDTINRYGWELDGVYPYDFDDAVGPSPTVTWDNSGTVNVGLKVWDNGVMNDLDHDGEVDENERLTDIQWTTVTIIPNLSPIADAGGPYTTDEGVSISLDSTASSDPNGDSLVFAWDLNGDGTHDDATGDTPDYTWPDSGIYTIEVKVSDTQLEDTMTAVVTVNDLEPTAAFSWLPESQNEGVSIVFTDESTTPVDDIVSWEWDFGSLASSNDQNPVFTFDDDGTYTVTLVVTDEDGSTNTASHEVTITDKAPIAILAGDTSLNQAQEGSYDASGSTSMPDEIDGYEWDWNYDGTTFMPSGDTGDTQTHEWSAAGTYTIAVRVTDDDASAVIATLQVIVNSLIGPSAALTGDSTLNQGQTGGYDASGSTIGSEPISGYTWDWNYDGVTFTPSGDTGPVQTHIWSDDGIYTVAVQITDDGGLTDIAVLQVIVNNSGPTAAFIWNPEPQDEGWPVQFNDVSTAPTIPIVQWHWVFAGIGTSIEQHPDFVFNDDGTYPVSLTITDEQGRTDTISQDVQVTNLPPSVDVGPDQTIMLGEAVTLDGSLDDPGSLDTHTVQIDWKEGTSIPVPLNQDQKTFSAEHTYQRLGAFKVLVTATDNDGGEGEGSAIVKVEEPLPCFDIAVRAKPGKVQLTWTHQQGTQIYHIYKADLNDPYAFEKIAETTSTYSTYLDQPVINEVTYLYYVKAIFVDRQCHSSVAAIHPTATRGRVNYAPVIYSQPVIRAVTDVPYQYQPRAADPNGNSLIWEVDEAPVGMIFNSNEGILSWTPDLAGQYTVRLRVTDGNIVDFQSFIIEVE